MKVVALVAAHINSTRLPGKVLRPIVGVPMLELMIKRLQRCQTLNEIIIATSVEKENDRICDFANARGYRIERGSEDDVLDRYYQIAKACHADVVVRLTGDCPLIDPGVIDLVVRKHLASRTNDLTSNVVKRTFPRGLDTEVLSFSCLDRIQKEAKETIYREHVTNFIYDYPDRFAIENVARKQNASQFRICIDTEKDFLLVEKIFEELAMDPEKIRLEHILELFERKPEIPLINRSVEQVKIFKYANQFNQ